MIENQSLKDIVSDKNSDLDLTEIAKLKQKLNEAFSNKKIKRTLLSELKKQFSIKDKSKKLLSEPEAVSEEDIALIQLFLALEGNKKVEIDGKNSDDLQDYLSKRVLTGFSSLWSGFTRKFNDIVGISDSVDVENLSSYIQSEYGSKVNFSKNSKEYEALVDTINFVFSQEENVPKKFLKNIFGFLDNNIDQIKFNKYMKSISVIFITYSYSDSNTNDLEQILGDKKLLRDIYENPDRYSFLYYQFDKYYNTIKGDEKKDINTTFSTFSYKFLSKLCNEKYGKEEIKHEKIAKKLIEKNFQNNKKLYDELMKYLYNTDFIINLGNNPDEVIVRLNELFNTPKSENDLIFGLMKYVKGASGRSFVLYFFKAKFGLNPDNILYGYISSSFDQMNERYLSTMNEKTFLFINKLLEAVKLKDKSKIKQVMKDSLSSSVSRFSLRDNEQLLSLFFEQFKVLENYGYSKEDIKEIKDYYNVFITSKSHVERELYLVYIPMLRKNVKSLIGNIAGQSFEGKENLAELQEYFSTMFSTTFIHTIEGVINKMNNGLVTYNDFHRILSIDLTHNITLHLRSNPSLYGEKYYKYANKFIESLRHYQTHPEELKEIIRTISERQLSVTKTISYLEAYEKMSDDNRAKLSTLPEQLRLSIINSMFTKDSGVSKFQSIKIDYLRRELVKYISKNAGNNPNILEYYNGILKILSDTTLTYDKRISEAKRLINDKDLFHGSSNMWIDNILKGIDQHKKTIDGIVYGLNSDEGYKDALQQGQQKYNEAKSKHEKLNQYVSSKKFESDIRDNWDTNIRSIQTNLSNFYETEYKYIVKKQIDSLTKSEANIDSKPVSTYTEKKEVVYGNDSYGLVKSDFGMYEISNPFYNEKINGSTPNIVGKLDNRFKLNFMHQYLLGLGINSKSFKFTADDLIDKLGIDISQQIDENNFDKCIGDLQFKLESFLGKCVVENVDKNFDSLPTTLPSDVGFKDSIKSIREEIIYDFVEKRFPKKGLNKFFSTIKGKEKLFPGLYEILLGIEGFDLSVLPKDYAIDLDPNIGSQYFFKMKLNSK